MATLPQAASFDYQGLHHDAKTRIVQSRDTYKNFSKNKKIVKNERGTYIISISLHRMAELRLEK